MTEPTADRIAPVAPAEDAIVEAPPEPKRRSVTLQFHQNIAPPSSQSKVSTGEVAPPDQAGKGVR